MAFTLLTAFSHSTDAFHMTARVPGGARPVVRLPVMPRPLRQARTAHIPTRCSSR